jgi:hypothetical protein
MTLGLHTLRNASVGELLSLLSHRRDDAEIDELCRRLEGLEDLADESEMAADIESQSDRIDSLYGRIKAARLRLADIREGVSDAIGVLDNAS